jgi:hypothetical protein
MKHSQRCPVIGSAPTVAFVPGAGWRAWYVEHWHTTKVWDGAWSEPLFGWLVGQDGQLTPIVLDDGFESDASQTEGFLGLYRDGDAPHEDKIAREAERLNQDRGATEVA